MKRPPRDELPLEARWQATAETLRSLPAPEVSNLVRTRTFATVQARLAARAERAFTRAVLAFLVAFGWTLSLAAKLFFDVVTGGLAVWLQRPIGPAAAWYAAYLLAGWLAAAAAAALLGRGAREEGRTL